MNNHREIVFLFGAGASYGAGGILPENPPLGFQLYDELEKIYPGSWGSLPSEYIDTFKTNFEDGMGLVYDNFGHNISQLMREMAIYFIQFRPIPGKSIYCKLIRFLKNYDLLQSVLFSTLNYECTLEYSLLSQNLDIDYFNNKYAAIPIWKLHGSCNMFSESLKVGQGISYGTGISFEGGVKAYLDSNEVIEECLIKSGLAPVMCLFMKGKPLQVSPSSIKYIQEEWSNHVLNAKTIFCIGVNPLPEDDHIWDHLSETQADLYFIGDQERFDEWSKKNRKDKSVFLSNYFHSGFEQILTKLDTK